MTVDMAEHARGTGRLRVLNTRHVLAAMRRAHDPVRISELAQMTALTRPTVSHIVAALESRGWVRRLEPAGKAGRPAVRYSVSLDRFAVVGADAGAHRAVVEVATLDGVRRARREHRRPIQLGEDMLTVLSSMMGEALAEAGLAREAVLAATVASPGIVEEPSGGIELRPGLGAWTAAEVIAALAPLVSGRVAVENDANLAARAMRTMAHMPEDFLSLQWGQRLGAGIVLDGQIFRGRHGGAGELGALLVQDPATGTMRHLEEVVRSDRLPLHGELAELRTEALISRAGAGDPVAQRALAQGIDPLAAAVAPLCVGLDLRTVAISGGIARSGPALVAAFQERLAAHGAIGIDCRLSSFREDTVLRGAVGTAVDSGWETLMVACDPDAAG
ncbi:ROK family transcriptional regulator [Ruania halotolerans]|uniref:ROK family transcriptional regulator n=1 Tax=Ruania halotolerans TaxID=2897773 RepID=UPI001E5D4A9D|nr:ROK family transcriptional regulator [Ruania halotolerans]UFU06467.1 ROK family transcriptional regulator [Ruania halotolerans]